MTYRIYALTDGQLDSLLQFLAWVPNAHMEDQNHRPECPLPILGDDNNLTRIEPDVAIPMHNVFRDRWERKAKWKDYRDYRMGGRRCVRYVLDFPELRPAFERKRGEKRLTFGEFLKQRRDGKGSGTQRDT